MTDKRFEENGDIMELNVRGNIVSVVTNGQEITKLWLCDYNMCDLLMSEDMTEAGNKIDKYMAESL